MKRPVATRSLPPTLASALLALPVLAWGAPAAQVRSQVPERLFEVTRVVDGDTIHVLRDGRTEKLRLLSVDTEEKLSGSYRGTRTKPQTVYGEECAKWAQEFFAALAEEDEPTRVGLRFPGEVERRDVYGRLLCHVVLPDGRDFNVLLVELGKSPYFMKYGHSLIDHDAFVAAEEEARARGLGIWNPETNRPRTPGAPSARRPYEELLPWWRARAAAVDDFRARRAEEPEAWIASEAPEALESAVGREVEVFGEISRTFEEDNGDLTVLFRSGVRDRALRVVIPAAERAAHADVDLAGAQEQLRQNYLYVRGEVGRNERGYVIVSRDPKAWRRAGPEPAIPRPASTR